MEDERKAHHRPRRELFHCRIDAPGDGSRSLSDDQSAQVDVDSTQQSASSDIFRAALQFRREARLEKRIAPHAVWIETILIGIDEARRASKAAVMNI